MSHDLMGSTAEKLGNVDFSDDEFIANLINFLTVDTGIEDYEKLACEAAKAIATARYQLPLLGTFEKDIRIEPEKVQKDRKKRQKNEDELKQPEKISALKKTDKGGEKINTVVTQIEKV